MKPKSFKRRAVAAKPLPFLGETMRCALCSVVRQSHPARSSQWHVVDVEATRFYVCPKHFPDDDAGEEAFTEAYTSVLERLIAIYNNRGRN